MTNLQRNQTVLEMLIQSKAEKLGLRETDLVVDQAIYAKAVDIVLSPETFVSMTHVEKMLFCVKNFKIPEIWTFFHF